VTTVRSGTYGVSRNAFATLNAVRAAATIIRAERLPCGISFEIARATGAVSCTVVSQQGHARLKARLE